MASRLQDELYFDVKGQRENRPTFMNESRVLEKYWSRISPELTAYLEKHLGYTPSFRDVEVEVTKLPTFYALGLDGIRPVGKVWGAYDPESKKMYLDPSLFDELGDPEQPVLERYGLRGKPSDTFVHELVHSVQDQLGAIHSHPHDYIEGVATKVTEDITGNRQKSYPKEKEKVDDLSRYFTPEELLKGARKINLN